MSNTLALMKYIKEKLTGKTQVPAERIFIAVPSTVFIGEGPVILIYQKAASRTYRAGDTNFHESSWYTDTIGVDALVDDLINITQNTNSLSLMCELQKEIETYLYGDMEQTTCDIVELLDCDVKQCAPGSATPYNITQEAGGAMVGISSDLVVTYAEEWQRVVNMPDLKKITGTIHASDEVERDFDEDL